MTHEILIKRTIHVSLCADCGERVERDANPPRERLCSCGKWVAFVETSWTGPSLNPSRTP